MGQAGGVGDAPCGYEETETKVKNAETDSLSRPGEAVGDILGVYGTCVPDAVGGRRGGGVEDAVHVPHGTVHADVRVLQPSCADDAVRGVRQEEGIAAVGADGGVCMS